MIFNLGSTAPVYELQIAGVPWATVTVSNTKKTYSQTTDAYGNAVFRKLKKGLWSVIVRKDSEEANYSVNVGRNQNNALNINAIPEFSYTGSYQIVDDNGNIISSAVKNWKVRLLTSGTFIFKKLNNAADGIDVFCVGGGGGGVDSKALQYEGTGGGGGGSGYTTTRNKIFVPVNQDNGITVGYGGNRNGYYDYRTRGGTTTAFGVTAQGGYSGYVYSGGDGGSGGGSAGFYAVSGGIDGGNGVSYSSEWNGGLGQGRTTREFGTGALYASGGSGGGTQGDTYNGASGGNNTGNGGSGGTNGGLGGSGGSGIVVIRNAR
jgi:hypothetical protein